LLPLSAILTSFLVKALLVLSTALNIPQSIIGLTILTLGNSIGDVVSIIGLGILGMTDVGIGACLGAPVGVVGLGVGLGGAGVLLHTRLTFSAEKLSEMGQTGVRYIAVAIDAHFVISCVQLVVMLGFLIGWFALGGKLDWRVGIWGILCWSGGMIVHLGSELVA
jgi:sodium/potassium/calcium exchanger 6